MPLFKYLADIFIYKMKLPYKYRFLSFKNKTCPYCNGKASLFENPEGVFRGECNDCKSHNKFSNKKCKEWV